MRRAALVKRQEYSIETTAERVARLYEQVVKPQRPVHPPPQALIGKRLLRMA
jgi:hypothetical protein